MRKLPKIRFRLFILVALSLVMLSSGISAQANLMIRVAAESSLDGDRVRLGDVSQISGIPNDVKRASEISLGLAPNVGATRQISRQEIALALMAAGFPAAHISTDSPPLILIRRSGQAVSNDQIRHEIERAIAGRFSADEVEVRIARLDLPRSLQVPLGKVEIRVNFSSVQNFFARFFLPVEIRVDGKVAQTLAPTVEIEAFAHVLVAARDLSTNAKPNETDVRLEKRRLERPIETYTVDATKLHGVQLIKDLSSGDALTANCLVSSVVIKYGDPVRLEARSGTIKILLIGEARSAGKIGDRIAVKNVQSGAIVQAIVVDEGIAKVVL
ncbi:MAG: flagellar basal body P-ring formation chaperone FlgA [Acidobacteriota bacterium]